MTKTKIALFAIPALAAVLIGAMMLPVYSEEALPLKVAMDIKPGSCPNPLNTNTNTEKEALVSVAILGTENFDVTKIRVESLLLNEVIRVEGVEIKRAEAIEEEAVKVVKVQRVMASIEDVATPFVKERDAPDEDRRAYQCNELEGDGFDDLVLKFDKQALVVSIAEQHSDDLKMTMTGNLLDGTAIEAVDVMLKTDTPDKKFITKPPIKK